MVGDVQPKCSDSTIAKVRTHRPAATSTAPGRSSRRAFGLRDSRTPVITSTSPMIPTGTFTQKTADQENSSTRMPPTTGPAPNPNPAAAAQIPIAAVRRSGGYASARIDRLRGATRAAPTPCAARAAMSADSFGDRAQAADIAVKIASPTTNRRLRPYRSPRVPPTRMSEARARTYALTTQSKLPGSTSSSR